ncbi:unnamed protein product [Aureobasidium vineae]|uniref:MYND-type domain-containing protein n=1 Tax=Aureobasidium vineae TaxID=2773715 RepID=A0A9N8K2D0_9PEZI|nr:unnamed protein product [Aureobasidium vineae]
MAPCSVCAKPGKACSGCHNSFYCSPECQKEDRRTHRLLCKTFKAFDDDHRPTTTSKRAIHFPEKGKCAFIWVEIRSENPLFHHWMTPDLRIILGEDDPKTLNMPRDFAAEKDPRHIIEINYRDAFTQSGSTPKQSIASMVFGKTNVAWSGPVVACGRGLNFHSHIYQDLDTTDLRFLDEFLQRYGIIRGVRINCNVTQELFGKPIFEEIFMQEKNVSELFSEGQQSQIAHRIGTPLRACLEIPSEDMEDPLISMKYSYATWLYMNCDLDTKHDLKTWGNAPEYQGNAIVVRQDKKRLCPKYLEALFSWCWQNLQPKFKAVTKQSKAKRMQVLAQVTKEDFELYREEYEKEGKTPSYD